MKSRKPLGKTGTQSVSGTNQIQHQRQQQHSQISRDADLFQNQSALFNQLMQDQNLFEAVHDAPAGISRANLERSMVVVRAQGGPTGNYAPGLKKYGSTGDQDDFGMRDDDLENTNMFVDRESGRKVRLPDISNLSHSSELPEGFQVHPPQNFQLDPYALRMKQSLPAGGHQVPHQASVELGLGKAQYYSQHLQTHPQAKPLRGASGKAGIRTADSEANLVDDAEIIK